MGVTFTGHFKSLTTTKIHGVKKNKGRYVRFLAVDVTHTVWQSSGGYAWTVRNAEIFSSPDGTGTDLTTSRAAYAFASSEYGGYQVASRGFNDTVSNYWGSVRDGSNGFEWLGIDLGQSYEIGSVTIDFYSPPPKAIAVQSSETLGNWVTLATIYPTDAELVVQTFGL